MKCLLKRKIKRSFKNHLNSLSFNFGLRMDLKVIDSKTIASIIRKDMNWENGKYIGILNFERESKNISIKDLKITSFIFGVDGRVGLKSLCDPIWFNFGKDLF